MEDFEPLETFEIDDLETLRVISDPLRTQIYETLIPEALAVNQIAEKLGLSATKLYYHVNLLEKYGLIQVVKTNTIGNLIEKYYRAVASNLEVASKLFSFSSDEGKENISAMVKSALDPTREDLLRSLEARAAALEQGAEERIRQVILTRLTSKISEEKAEEFQERLKALLKEFDDANIETAERAEALQDYALMVTFYPSFYFHGPEEEQK